MSQKHALAALLLFVPLLSTAGDTAAPPVSFKTDLQPLLNAQCVFCHVTGAENAGLNLGRRVAHASLTAPSTQAPLARVVPGQPDKSYLLHKLKGTQLSVGGSGNTMPMYDPPRLMEPAQIDLFVRWIENGAPNN